MSEKLASERLEYVQQLEAQITETKAMLETLKAERNQAMQSIQHEEIENLEKYLDQAHINLKDLSASAEDAWHELRETLEKLMTNIRSSLMRLRGGSDDSSEE
ncbi:MAG: hypothetical protein VKK04_01350 [Synechococcales bacterium]|nr:hypothetical protein [Synechococcales bacterium]